MTNLILEVGKFYKSRIGRISRIIRFDEKTSRFIDHKGRDFVVTGQSRVLRKFPSDLVEEVEGFDSSIKENFTYVGRAIKSKKPNNPEKKRYGKSSIRSRETLSPKERKYQKVSESI